MEWTYFLILIFSSILANYLFSNRGGGNHHDSCCYTYVRIYSFLWATFTTLILPDCQAELWEPLTADESTLLIINYFRSTTRRTSSSTSHTPTRVSTATEFQVLILDFSTLTEKKIKPGEDERFTSSLSHQKIVIS